MTWGVLKWGAVVICVGTAVGLGVDVSVDGPQGAQGLAGVVGALCEVVAVVLAIVGWVNEKRSTVVAPASESASTDDAVAEPTVMGVGRGKYVVDARDAKNVQIGDGNTMNTGVCE